MSTTITDTASDIATARANWAAVERIIQDNFEKPDLGAVRVTFACVAAHRISEYPPAWLLSITPSGSLKTVIVESLKGLPSIHFVDEVTPRTFISGKIDQKGKKRQTAASFLHRMGPEGILICGDFSTVLAMSKDAKAQILAQLRRIYDGSLSREFGSDENLPERMWEGRLTFLGGATPDVDRHHAIFQSLGERFVRIRWPRAGGISAGLSAMQQKRKVFSDLRAAVKDLMLPILGQSEILPPELPPEYERRIANLTEFVALARAYVPRDRRDREAYDKPAPEGNTRLPQELAQVGRGLAVLDGRDTVNEDDLTLIRRVAFDCIPPLRRSVIEALLRGESPYDSEKNLPPATVSRALEDLQMVGLTVPKHTSGLNVGGKTQYELSQTAQQLLADAGIQNNLPAILTRYSGVGEGEGKG